MHAVIFTIDDRRYGVPVADVVEIVRAVAITRVPGTPPAVAGVIDVRGTVVPVLDTRRRFGHPPRALSPDERFVIARAGARMVALRADDVALEELAPGQLDDAAARVAAADHIVGIARLPDGLVLVHDVARFLSAAESDALDGALAAAHAGAHAGAHAAPRPGA